MSTREALVSKCVLVKKLEASVGDDELTQFLFDKSKGGNVLKIVQWENIDGVVTRVVLFPSHGPVKQLLTPPSTCTMISRQQDGQKKELSMSFDLCTPDNIPTEWVREEGPNHLQEFQSQSNVKQYQNLIDFEDSYAKDQEITQVKRTGHTENPNDEMYANASAFQRNIGPGPHVKYPETTDMKSTESSSAENQQNPIYGNASVLYQRNIPRGQYENDPETTQRKIIDPDSFSSKSGDSGINVNTSVYNQSSNPDFITGQHYPPQQQIPYIGYPPSNFPQYPGGYYYPPPQMDPRMNMQPAFDPLNQMLFSSSQETGGYRTPPPAYYSGEYVHPFTDNVPPNILSDQRGKERYYQESFDANRNVTDNRNFNAGNVPPNILAGQIEKERYLQQGFAPDNSSSAFSVTGNSRIKVSNIPEGTIEDDVLNFFEQRRRSGGGDISTIDYNCTAHTAVITFEDPLVAVRVMQKCPIMMGKNLLSVSLYDGNEDTESSAESMVSASDELSTTSTEGTFTIEVRGFTTKTTDDTLVFYFENTKRSGGDEVIEKKIDRENLVAYLTFESEEVISNILKRKHTVDGVTLEVKRQRPASPLMPKQMYGDRVFLKNVASKTTQDGLQIYLELVSGSNSPESVLYGEEEGCALVWFQEPLDFSKMKSNMEKRPLDGHILEMHKVPISKCILVKSFHPSTSSDSLKYYFENPKRAGGGDVQKVDMNRDESTALVYFEQCEVAERVSRRSHTLDDKSLEVALYHECLGQTATEKPKLKIPEPVSVDVDKDKLKFVSNLQLYKDQITSQLVECHAEIVWPQDVSDSLKLNCTIDENTTHCRKLVKSWKSSTISCIEAFFNKLVKYEVQVLQDAFSELLESLKNMKIQSKDSVSFFVSKENCRIVIIGKEDSAAQIKNEVELLKKSVEEEFERKKQQVSEAVTDLKSYQVRLLLADKFHEKMHKKYSFLKVKITVSKNEIILTGPAGDVQSAQVEMYKMVTTIGDYTVHKLHSGVLQLLQVRDVKDYIVKKLRDKKLISVWDIDNDLLKVYAFSDKMVCDSAKIVSSSVVSSPVELTDESLSVLSSPQWHSKKQELTNQYPNVLEITFSIDTKELWVFCTDNIISSVRENISDFLSQNTIYQKNICAARGVLRFLYTHLEKELQSISKSLEHLFVRLEYKANDTKIQVRGSQAGIEKACSSFSAMIQKVQSRKHFIKKPGIFNLMTSEKGQQNMIFVEKQVKCAIEVDGASDDVIDDEKRESRRFSSGDVAMANNDVINAQKFTDDISMSDTTLEMCAHCILPDGLKIFAGVGDMTEMKVDVVVNAANKQLEHSGGLSKVIVSKGGKKIQKECHTYLATNGELKDGEAIITSAGSLPCKSVIHAVGPTWQGGQKSEEDLLWTAVITCLELASKKGYKSIAFPALSAGMFGYPISEATRVIVDAIKDATKEIGIFCLKEIFVCDIKRDNVNHFVKSMETVFGQKVVKNDVNQGMHSSVPRISKEINDGSPPITRIPKAKSTQKIDVAGDRIGSSLKIDDSLLVDTLETLPIEVKLLKGDMAAQKVDCIVNTTGCSLDLDSGAVSKAIFSAAGSSIQTECQTNYANGINHGEIAVTTAGNLSAQGMKFIFHVSLPTYDGTAGPQMAFEFEDQKRRGKGKVRQSRQLQSTDAGNKESRFFDVDESKTSQNAPKMNDDMSFSFDLGSLTLLVRQGDITCEQSDALVNSSNPDLDLKRGAVSKVLLQKCGNELTRQCVVQKPTMAKEGIAVTAAKGLPGVQILIHVVAADTPKDWKTAIIKCLKKAEEYKVTTVAFPAIGTNIGMKPGDMAKVMYDSLIEFSKDPSHSLKEVRLIVFRKEMVSTIFSAINKCFEEYGIKPQSMFKRAAGFVGGLFGYSDKNDDICSSFNAAVITQRRPVDIEKEEIVLKIFSDNLENIENARKHIDQFCDSQFSDKHIMDDVIKMFTESQVAEFKEYASKNFVNVIFEKRIGRIRLQGLTEHVWKVKDELHSLMRRTEKAKHQGEQAEDCKRIVQWGFLEIADGEQLIKYDTDINYKLEKAYKSGARKIELVDNRNIKYIIDFVNMVDYPAHKPDDKATVIRKDLIKAASFDKPNNWSDMGDSEILKLVQISETDAEFQTVEANFRKTVPSMKIVKIERIQNKTLYQQYTAKKASLDQQNPSKNNESNLFHGTAPEAIPSINNYGFNRSYCGKNATVHGLGVYFARDANYSCSNTYSRPDASGNKHMYQCRVLTGEYAKSNSSYRVPPVKSGIILYDTVVDNVANPQIYVIFNDTQAYPDYLITFK